MIAEAFKWIEKHVQPVVVEVEGRQYTTVQTTLIKPPSVEPLHVHTLDGLLGIDFPFKDADLIVVNSPTMVSIFSIPDILYKKRDLLAQAEPILGKPFRLSQWMPIETFIIEVMAKFEDTDEKANLLKTLGTIQSGATRTNSDDGVTQEVTVKQGARMMNKSIKNPVTLIPFSTFQDILQPSKRYILRLLNVKDGEPQVALFPVESGNWEYDTMLSIKKYLEGKTDIKVVI